jgi:hypothetical protein
VSELVQRQARDIEILAAVVVAQSKLGDISRLHVATLINQKRKKAS